MKKVIMCFSVIMCFAGAVFATGIPEWLVMVENSDRSIVLDWDDVERAEGYYIYYGTQTWKGGAYDIEGVDLIENSDTLLESLIPDTEYYIAVTAIDEFGQESDFSTELQVRTRWEWGTPNSSFQALGVEVIDENTLEIEFNKDIDANNSSERTFIIEDKEMGTEIPVDISELDQDDPTRLFVLLGVDMVENTDYKVTILDLQDSEGNSIEAWIDAFLTFSTPVSFSPLEAAPVQVVSVETENETVIVDNTTSSAQNEEDTSVTVQNTNSNVNVSQDDKNISVAVTDNKNTEEEIAEEKWESTQQTNITISPLNASANVTGSIAGKTLSEEEIWKGGVNQVAAKNDKLPKTGPEMWVLFLLIALFWGWILYIVNMKKAS